VQFQKYQTPEGFALKESGGTLLEESSAIFLHEGINEFNDSGIIGGASASL